jgi:hypothetical protein
MLASDSSLMSNGCIRQSTCWLAERTRFDATVISVYPLTQLSTQFAVVFILGIEAWR